MSSLTTHFHNYSETVLYKTVSRDNTETERRVSEKIQQVIASPQLPDISFGCCESNQFYEFTKACQAGRTGAPWIRRQPADIRSRHCVMALREVNGKVIDKCPLRRRRETGKRWRFAKAMLRTAQMLAATDANRTRRSGFDLHTPTESTATTPSVLAGKLETRPCHRQHNRRHLCLSLSMARWHYVETTHMPNGLLKSIL